jgi:hypothetical protein
MQYLRTSERCDKGGTMEERKFGSLGRVSLWLGIGSVALAFTPIIVAFALHTSGFSDRAFESALSFVVPALLALAAIGLGTAELVQKRRGKRLAVLGTALAVIALAGWALTLGGFEQAFGR